MDTAVMGQRIRAARVARGMSQLELAKAVGIGDSSICQYETGRKAPTLGMFAKLCEQLHVSADYLLGNTNNPEIGNSYTPVAITTARLAMVRAVNLLDDMLCDHGIT